ncbi:hypothetical protein D9615_009817 [Tricholomella constricta]|uniref:F-box domain-containing protein n=1 Tax=Tricholomella constricta TaxID=117010 RepID=A0A8H5LVB9_9AGAR|nr:hypothetical protein D9615_009817 [Tricholomella constricta]
MVHCLRDTRRLSPIQRLPVELLSYIFALGTHNVVNDDDASCPPFNAETIKTPLILSRVNHHWRNVARNTPSLWTSICVTAELVDDGDGLDPPKNRPQLNANHLTTYLSLSRNYPLDILVDARDQDWDFSEPEIPSDYECDTYTPPFSSSHMKTAISHLLPHLSRWRCVSILTDSWAPMYVALQQIQPYITTLGAPRLESLTLMRCNDFVSYSNTFQPQNMKDPAFLYLSEGSTRPQNILPRLRHLTLRGVHVDWASLSTILSHSQRTLDTLELSSHSLDVRPTLPEFRQLLSTCPRLTKLVVSGSGPGVSEDVDEGNSIVNESLHPVPLPCLREISLGYRSIIDGLTVLELLDAPNAKVLTLEDATHPGEPEDVDAGSLLTYVGTGEIPTRDDHDFILTYTTPDGQEYQLPINKSPTPSPNTQHHHQDPNANAPAASRAVFPLLEDVTLRGVKSCPRPLHTFFGALPHLRRLELSSMPIQAIRALLPPAVPGDPAAYATAPCPCPLLQSLCIRGFHHHPKLQEVVFLFGGLALERLNKGGCGLKEVDIYVDDTSGSCVTEEDVVRVSDVGTRVKIIREVLHLDEDDENEDEDEEDDFMDCDSDDDFDPYEAGGAFNDPAFDAHYAGRALAR